MSLNRFFVDHVAEGAQSVVLTGREARHAGVVLRLQPGDTVEVRDGKGRGWHGTISQVRPGEVHVRLTGEKSFYTESHLTLTLGLAYSRTDKMELVVRQATELGVNRIVVFRAERSQYSLTGAQAEKRKGRWLKIAREALCQCSRSKLPEITIVSDINELTAETRGWRDETGSLGILALEEEYGQSLLSVRQRFPVCRQVLVTVGPEGGWTRAEVEQFLDAGFLPVHLGPRILRVETAAMAFLTAAQLLWGDFGISSSEGRKKSDHEMQ